MRQHIFLFLLASMAVAGCSNTPKEEIEHVAQGYLEAAGDYRLDDAMPYASRNTREFVLPFYKIIMETADTSYINSNRPVEITIQSTKMLSDSTARVYYHKHTPIQEDDDSVFVILEEGQWRVHVEIAIPAFLMNDSTQAMPPIERALDPKRLKRLTKLPAGMHR